MRCSCMVALYTILAAVQLICFVELIMEGGYTCVLQYGIMFECRYTSLSLRTRNVCTYTLVTSSNTLQYIMFHWFTDVTLLILHVHIHVAFPKANLGLQLSIHDLLLYSYLNSCLVVQF